MNEKNIKKDSIVIWQEVSEENIPEPSILIEPYTDFISIRQERDCIRLNYESVAEFIKLLKSLNQPE